MPSNPGDSELRAAVVRDRSAAPPPGVPHVGARLLLVVVLFAVCAALLALAIGGRRSPERAASPPATVAAVAPGAWAPLARLTGRTIRTSATFYVTAARWRVRWRVIPRAGGRERYFRVLVNGPRAVESRIAVSLEGQPESACVLHGFGPRSLTVLSHHSYEVVAEEWRPTAPAPATD